MASHPEIRWVRLFNGLRVERRWRGMKGRSSPGFTVRLIGKLLLKKKIT